MATKQGSVWPIGKKFRGRQIDSVDLYTTIEPILGDAVCNLLPKRPARAGNQINGERRASDRVFTNTVAVTVQKIYLVQQRIRGGYIVGPLGGIWWMQRMIGRGVRISNL